MMFTFLLHKRSVQGSLLEILGLQGRHQTNKETYTHACTHTHQQDYKGFGYHQNQNLSATKCKANTHSLQLSMTQLPVCIEQAIKLLIILYHPVKSVMAFFFLTDKNKASSRKCLVSWATPIYCAVWHCTVVTDIYKDYQLKWSSKSQWHMERTLSTGKYWTFWIRFNHARMYKPNNGHTMVIRFKQGMQLLTPPWSVSRFQSSYPSLPHVSLR